MNFLAHLYLSYQDNGLLLGNFIGDFVKGKESKDYSHSVELGILMHRKIDEFTDDHPIVLESKKRLRPKYHHYAPVIVDVYYDHFLAKDWRKYHDEELMDFTQQIYSSLKLRSDEMPEKAAHVLHFMQKDNWLYHYQFIDGIHQALSGMSRRTRFDSKMEEAVVDLEGSYELYKDEFERFFPELISFCKDFQEQI